MGSLEREVKLELDGDVALPTLTGVGSVAEVRTLTDQALDAVYFDTAEHGLLAVGATLRRRTGEPGAVRWTFKVPHAVGVGDGRLERLEVELDDDATQPPVAMVEQAAGLVSGSLAPVARLRSTRRRIVLLDADGQVLAEVDDDVVTADVPGRETSRFREVEIELGPAGDVGLLVAVSARLAEVGAVPGDARPKLARALDADPSGRSTR